MLYLGKYIGYIFRGAGRILFYPIQAHKYIKNKDNYLLQERYDFVKVRARKVLSKILKVNIDVIGMENLNTNETFLFVPNHQSLLDPVCLMSIFDKSTIFVSKKEARTIPVVGKINYMMNAIFFDRNSPRDALRMVKECKEYLSSNTSVVIFPEGTRSKNELIDIQEYKAGAFKCAYGTGAKIVPVVIDRTYMPLSIKKKSKDKTIKISFLAPIAREEYENMNTTDLALFVENKAKIELEKLRKQKNTTYSDNL